MTCFTLCWACCPGHARSSRRCWYCGILLRAALSARFFRLAWLTLPSALRCLFSFAVPVQDRPAPLSIPLPTAAVRQAALPAAPAESGGAQQAAASEPGKAVPFLRPPPRRGRSAPGRACPGPSGWSARRCAWPRAWPPMGRPCAVCAVGGCRLRTKRLRTPAAPPSAGACASTPWPAGYAHAGGPFASGCLSPEGAGLRSGHAALCAGP